MISNTYFSYLKLFFIDSNDLDYQEIPDRNVLQFQLPDSMKFYCLVYEEYLQLL
jgi:hypothetical protein